MACYYVRKWNKAVFLRFIQFLHIATRNGNVQKTRNNFYNYIIIHNKFSFTIYYWKFDFIFLFICFFFSQSLILFTFRSLRLPENFYLFIYLYLHLKFPLKIYITQPCISSAWDMCIRLLLQRKKRQEKKENKNDRKFMVEYITASIVGNLKPSSDAWITRQYFLFRFLFFFLLVCLTHGSQFML